MRGVHEYADKRKPVIVYSWGWTRESKSNPFLPVVKVGSYRGHGSSGLLSILSTGGRGLFFVTLNWKGEELPKVFVEFTQAAIDENACETLERAITQVDVTCLVCTHSTKQITGRVFDE